MGGENANRKSKVRITTRVERASVVGVLLKISSDFIQNTPPIFKIGNFGGIVGGAKLRKRRAKRAKP